MKIEISEVFVTRTDAMTLDQTPCAIGIAALEPRETAVAPNTKTRHFALFDAFSRYLTAKAKNMFRPRSTFHLHLDLPKST
jgi:hypothetical protein